jgi:uncharacterized protein YdaU (DUF1376 family)
MSAAPYFKLYFSDFAGDTLHLTDAEIGSYVLLLGAMWNGKGSLPNDPRKLARVARCSPNKWVARWDSLSEFFLEDGQEITHKRVKIERKKVDEISHNRSLAGIASAESKALKLQDMGSTLVGAGVQQTDQQTGHIPDTIAIAIEGKREAKASVPSGRSRTDYPEAFEAAWKAYPHESGRSSKPNSLKEWRMLPGVEQTGMVGAISRMRPEAEKAFGGKGAPDMARWLKAGKHLSYPAPDTVVPEFEWKGPAWIKAEVMSHHDHKRLSAYLDRCEWKAIGKGGNVTCARSLVVDVLKEGVGAQLADQGVTINLAAKVSA